MTARPSRRSWIRRADSKKDSDFISSEAHTATFDNNGTLWCEKPLPIQADFLFRRLAALVEQDSSLAGRQPWKAVAEKDYGWLGGVMTKHYQSGFLSFYDRGALPWQKKRVRKKRRPREAFLMTQA